MFDQIKYPLASGILSALAISLAFVACGGDQEPPPCATCTAGGGAVLCYQGFGPPQTICAPDQNLAAISCTEGGGTYVPIDLCPVEPGETGDDNTPPFEPGRDVYFDAEAKEYVIDQLALEALELDPAPLFSDTTHLEEVDSGHYGVVRVGELARALGWRQGDVLVELDGFPLRGLRDFSAAYTAISDQQQFELLIERGRDEVVLRYRVE